MKRIENIIKSTHKSYCHLARIEIDGDKLVNRNKGTKALHPFSDGRLVIRISDSMKVRLREILSDL